MIRKCAACCVHFWPYTKIYYSTFNFFLHQSTVCHSNQQLVLFYGDMLLKAMICNGQRAQTSNLRSASPWFQSHCHSTSWLCILYRLLFPHRNKVSNLVTLTWVASCLCDTKSQGSLCAECAKAFLSIYKDLTILCMLGLGRQSTTKLITW